MKRPRTPPAAQEAQEAMSWEGPHHGLDAELLGLLAYGSGQGPGLCSLGAPPSRVSGHLISITTAFSLLSLLGVEAQTVVQEPSLSVSPGGTVTLTCGLSSGSVTTYNEPSWYRETPGQAPRNVIYNTNTRASGVPDRFSASISGNKVTLTITGAQPEDKADYHCLLYQGSGSYGCTVMGAHGEVLLNPAHVLGGSAFRGRRGRKWSEPLWGRRLQIHLLSHCSWPLASCSLSLGVSRSPKGPLSP